MGGRRSLTNDDKLKKIRWSSSIIIIIEEYGNIPPDVCIYSRIINYHIASGFDLFILLIDTMIYKREV